MISVAPTITALANAIADLPRAAALSTRAVIVPTTLGHALRRHLIEAGHGAALAGTRFLPPLAHATNILETAGLVFRSGEDGLRPARLLGLFRRGIPLRHFPLELLRDNPGWEDAVARSIGDLEGAGLSPDALEVRAAALGDEAEQVRDVALLWRALLDEAKESWSRARILIEATALLDRAAVSLPDEAVLAAVTGHETAVLARFLATIPGIHLVMAAQRPARVAWLDRVAVLFGAAARAAAAAEPAPIAGAREIEILQSALFIPPEQLAAKSRPRSNGPDGTVHLAEYAGVEEEVQAASDWVAELVLAGFPLGEIAVLTPSADPWAALIAERLRRLPWPSGELPVFVASGLPCIGTAAGARLLALIRALRAFLPIEQMPVVLAALRPAEGFERLSHAAAIGVAGALGTIGGNGARPEGSRDWANRARARHGTLLTGPEKDEHSKEAQANRTREELRGHLAAVLPALEALDDLARLVLEQASLREVSSALVAFCEAYLLQPGEGAPPAALLAAALEPLAADSTCGALAGDDALRVIEEELLSLRTTAGRFGDAAVFVGTVRDAAGLPFRAVRIVGLCEGALPSAPREDPVLPDALRRRLDAPGLRTTAESALAQLHSLRRCVIETRDQLVLSAPRADPDGSQRQPSAVFLEALAALGRPGSEPVDLRALQFAGFRPARKEAEARREASPTSAAAQLWRVARRRSELPLPWHQAPSLDLRRIRELKAGIEIEGQLDELVPLRLLPGVSTERSISASRLSNLLGCPHRFLWNSALGWDEPVELPSTGALDPLSYGSLFHGAAEAIFKQHGEDIGAGKRSITHWKKRALELADAAFDRSCEQHPLAGEAVQEQQRDRLHRDVTTFMEHEWAASHRTVLVEHPFGKPVPVKLKLASGTLHVSGFIDRVDIEGGRTLVRDLKTGRSHPRRGDELPPSLGLDLQLGLYGLVVKHLAAGLGLPKKIAGAYVYVDRVGERERAFGDDYGDLEDAARVWLDAALQLLNERAFPRTTTADDCKWCCFRPVCGDDAPHASSAALEGSEGALAAFRLVRGGGEEEDDE